MPTNSRQKRHQPLHDWTISHLHLLTQQHRQEEPRGREQQHKQEQQQQRR